MLSNSKKPAIDLSDDFFGCLLNCAVRYACGRQSYMPSLVVDEIRPLLPYLSDKTLWCFDQDLTNARYDSGYGDPDIDEPLWQRFHSEVREERKRRGEELYVDWHPHDFPTKQRPNSKYTTIQVQIDSDILREAEQILADQQYSIEQAIYLFFRWCIVFPTLSRKTILEWKKHQEKEEPTTAHPHSTEIVEKLKSFLRYLSNEVNHNSNPSQMKTLQELGIAIRVGTETLKLPLDSDSFCAVESCLTQLLSIKQELLKSNGESADGQFQHK